MTGQDFGAMDEKYDFSNYWDNEARVQACLKQAERGILLSWEEVRTALYEHLLTTRPDQIDCDGLITPNATLDLLRDLSNFPRSHVHYSDNISHRLDAIDRLFLRKVGPGGPHGLPAWTG